MRRRVVITGMGAVTPLGHSVEALYAAACAGKNGVAPITHFDAQLPDHVRRRGEGLRPRPVPAGRRTVGEQRRQHPVRPGGRQAGAGRRRPARPGGVDRTRCGVYLGSGEGIHDFPHLITTIARAYQPERPDDRRRRLLPPRPADCSTARGERTRDAHHAGRTWPSTFDLEGPELQLPDRLRRQQPGDRRGDRHHPLRRRRHHALRRLAQHDPPARRDRVQPAHRPVAAQ